MLVRVKNQRMTKVGATAAGVGLIAAAMFCFPTPLNAQAAALAAETDNPAQQTSEALTQPTPEAMATMAVATPEAMGVQWFNRMSQALRQLNFEATLVHTQGDRIQPLLWLHGRHADGLEVELLVQLNGADVRILRLGDTTSYYFQPSDNSYSLQSDVTYGLLPAAFYQRFSTLSDFYQVIAGTGMRVTGRNTQFLRLVSRDNSRYHYGLWVDRETGMLLKMQMTTPQGEVLEQVQLTSFQVRSELPVSLADLRGVQRPPRLFELQQMTDTSYGVMVDWLPGGFQLQRKNHRRLLETNVPTDYFLYSDGLTDVSIYVSPASDVNLPNLSIQGPESLVTAQRQNFAITVVGKLPVETLNRIADSIRVANPS